jgi:hypothetical protein
METKVFEIRDAMTFIPALGVRIAPVVGNDAHNYLLRHAGYVDPLILLTRLDGGKSCYDPYDWADRTWQVAHNYITEHWDNLGDGDVIDVQYILGETPERKVSERIAYPI